MKRVWPVALLVMLLALSFYAQEDGRLITAHKDCFSMLSVCGEKHPCKFCGASVDRCSAHYIVITMSDGRVVKTCRDALGEFILKNLPSEVEKPNE